MTESFLIFSIKIAVENKCNLKIRFYIYIYIFLKFSFVLWHPAKKITPKPKAAGLSQPQHRCVQRETLELVISFWSLFTNSPNSPDPTLIPVSEPTEGRSQARPSRGEPGGIPRAGRLSHTFMHHARYLYQLGTSHCASGRSMELSQAR